MCYDLKVLLESQIKRAQYKGDYAAVAEIEERLIPLTNIPLYHVSGFSHPDILIYTDRSPDFPEVGTWGLIPHWIKNTEQQKNIWNKTLNARGETIFEKPSFRDSALDKRCLIYVDGFYEHHHFNGKTYPFHIYRSDKQPLTLAGLYNEWDNPEGGVFVSFTIVTTEGNELLKKIHNNPKLKGPRMPLILNPENEDLWLEPINSDTDKKGITDLIRSNVEIELDCHTVAKLRGKTYQGNVESIVEKVEYEELELTI